MSEDAYYNVYLVVLGHHSGTPHHAIALVPTESETQASGRFYHFLFRGKCYAGGAEDAAGGVPTSAPKVTLPPDQVPLFTFTALPEYLEKELMFVIGKESLERFEKIVEVMTEPGHASIGKLFRPGSTRTLCRFASSGRMRC